MSDTFPSAAGCPHGGMHKWYNLGIVGNLNYQCRKCGVLIKSKTSPAAAGCPNGGQHSWNKL